MKELRELSDYLNSSEAERARELLETGAFLLPVEKRRYLVVQVLPNLRGKAREHALWYLQHLDTDPDDDDNEFEDLAGRPAFSKAVVDAGEIDFVPYVLRELAGDVRESETPSWQFLEYRGELPRGWLVHCTPSGVEIASRGFTYGVQDKTKLGLTVHLDPYFKTGAGYNFAFTPDALDQLGYLNDEGCPYGSDLVLFRAPSVAVWHKTDKEHQAVFWGPDAQDLSAFRLVGSDVYQRLPEEETFHVSTIHDLVERAEQSARAHKSRRRRLLEA